MSKVLEESPLEAGRQAAARHAWRDALELLKRADEEEALGPEDVERLAEAAWWSGRLDECIAARERAYAAYIEAGEPRRAALVALMLAEDYFGKLAHSIGAGWFNRAERLLENESECAELGYLALMHAKASVMAGDLDRAMESANSVLDIGTRYGDRDLQAFGLMIQGKVLVNKGQVKDGLALLDEATVAAVGGELGPFASGMIYCMAISITAELADYERAGQWTEASRRWCERQAIAGFPGICRVHRAEIMRLRGSWAEAEQEARRALTELQNFNLQFAGEGFYELGEVRLRMGDLEAAEDAFRQAHELGREPQPGLALLRLYEGKTDAALASITRSVEDPNHDPLGRARLLPGMVEIAIAADDLDAARSAVEDFEEIAKTYDSLVLKASSLCARGALQLAEGDPRAAAATLRQSTRLWKQADLPYESARARLLLGMALRDEGDEDGGAMEIAAARSAFEKLGAILDLRRAMELLGDDAPASAAATPGARVIKTFMFTDIVGSTKLAEVLEDDWESLLSWHDEALRKLFMVHNGEEVNKIGDGFFVAFETAHDAVECAVAIQQALAKHRKETGFALKVRIGIHCAEAKRKGHDYGGIGVHEAARIGALAQGGEILLSRRVLDEVKLRFPVEDTRTVELKGVAEPVEIGSIRP